MCCTVVDVQTSGEAHAPFEIVAFFEPRVTRQSSDGLFDTFSYLVQSLTRLHPFLSPLPDLSVYFGCLTILVQEIVVHAVKMPLLFARGAVGIFVLVLDFFAHGVLLVCEELADWYSRRIRLSIWRSLLLLLGPLLFLLLCG